jgi:hypothetical protein
MTIPRGMLGAVTVRAALGLVIAIWPLAVRATPQDHPPPAPVAQLGAKVEVRAVAGAPHAIVTAQFACGTPPRCPDRQLDLGPASDATMAGLADLLAGGHYYIQATNPGGLGSRWLDQKLGANAKLPAAFVRLTDTSDPKEPIDRLAVISLAGDQPTKIGWIELGNRAFHAISAPQLGADRPGEPFEILVTQQQAPPPANSPGGLAHHAYQLRDGVYRQAM